MFAFLIISRQINVHPIFWRRQIKLKILGLKLAWLFRGEQRWWKGVVMEKETIFIFY